MWKFLQTPRADSPSPPAPPVLRAGLGAARPAPGRARPHRAKHSIAAPRAAGAPCTASGALPAAPDVPFPFHSRSFARALPELSTVPAGARSQLPAARCQLPAGAQAGQRVPAARCWWQLGSDALPLLRAAPLQLWGSSTGASAPLRASASTTGQGSKPPTPQRLLSAPVPLSMHFPPTFQGCVNLV